MIDPPSPCNRVCRIDTATGWCIGCRRSMDEIAAWPTMAPQAKAEVLARIQTRPASAP
ncbi:DUF1289 domain-containing protein [Novosphingobium sp. FSY-8]|uniref:DUF1289 domain-containing protein n=1 Tax=Novosphingobium ovatum TaxID=1908523 RepID=A0ABW9XEL5_9SPHN|nr:DUF1289 domain-containing protein [Novosphingobium ovatum]NBC36980.1 DUF1289 domain-containing protein [Novosphingobium ovatum]